MFVQEIMVFIKDFGYIGLFLIVFLESFPMTFFFPGDSLLFVTGFLASQGLFNFPILVIVLFLAGTTGYLFSYLFGQKIIKRLFTNEKSKIFNPKYITHTHDFYEKYGTKTIIIGRFVPVIRSFGPSLAGVADMTFKKFMVYNIIGGIIWAAGVTSIGYYLGRLLPTADVFLTPIIVGIIFVSILPTIFEYIKDRSDTSKNVAI